MVKRRFLIVLCILCLLPFPVLAVSTADAQEPISPETPCTLTLQYAYDGTAFAGVSVKGYQVATVSADMQYTLTSAFASSGLQLNGIQTTGEWDVIRSTLEGWILANAVEANLIGTTDDAGQVVFETLTPGLYLVVAEPQTEYQVDPALVALPGLGEDGLWQYSVTVNAKAEPLPPVEPDEKIEMKVLKLWKGDKESNRPKTIQVEIFRDGKSYETVTLSKENQWAYTWSAPADGAKWQVVERNIPKGYTVTVEDRTTAFVLTNTYKDPNPPETPPTGDTMNVMLYIILLNVSGLMLIILAIVGKKKRV